MLDLRGRLGFEMCFAALAAAALMLLLQVRAAEMPLGATGAHSWHVLRGFKHSAGGW